MKRFLILILLILPTVRLRLAADTHTAATCGQVDVLAAYTAASDGDIVAIPAGTCEWTGSIGLSMASDKGVTLQGAGTGQTILVDNTTLHLIRFEAFPTRSYRFTGIEVQHGTVAKGSPNTTFLILGTTTNFRVDHWKVDYQQPGAASASRWIRFTTGSITGVIDHNEILLGTGANNTAFNFYQNGWGSGTATCNFGTCENGDGSWAEPAYWGTDKFLFVEDNIIDARLGGGGALVNDANGGARFVFRFNAVYRASGGLATHGTESGGRTRAPRAIENYFNQYDNTGFTADNAGVHRGGGLLAFGNVHINYTGLWGVRNIRSGLNSNVWRSSDGSYPFDINDGAVYHSGTVTAVISSSNTSATIEDSNADWDTDEWSKGGFSIRNCKQDNFISGYMVESHCVPMVGIYSTGTGTEGSYVTANTANRLTYAKTTTASTAFVVGDNYKILRTTRVMDAVGLGAGKLLSGSTPQCPVADPCLGTAASWIEQEDEPSYAWNNTLNGVNGAQIGSTSILVSGNHVDLTFARSPHIIQDRDIFQHVALASFDGTSGVTSGTRAQMDTFTTCTEHRGFWVTDEGAWNLSGGDNVMNYAGHGRLYVCNDSNTWVLHYTPYRYPHPLASGGEDPPTTPILTSLSLTSGTRTECAMGCEVILAGSGFSEGNFAVTISGTDVTDSCMVDTDAQATCDFTIESDAATTARTVTVDTDGGTSNGQTFTVRGPIITSVVPQGVNQDTTDLVVTLTGTDLNAANLDITFDPATDLTADTEACSSSTSCTFELDVAAGAAPGLRTLTWTTFDGADTDQLTIEIVSSGATPSISHITSTVGYRGTTVNLAVNGVNLTGGTLATNCPTGLTFSNETVVSDTQITAQLGIGASMEIGFCDIYVQGTSNLAFGDAGGTGANANTLDPLPTHAAGNLILQVVNRKDDVVACDVPAGWTEVSSPVTPGGQTAFWMGVYYLVAEDSMETSGTWTNCTRIAAAVYEDVASSPIGTVEKISGFGGDHTFAASTFQVSDGSSFAVGVVCDRSSVTTTAPTGMTNRTTAGTGTGGSGRCAIHDTNAGVEGYDGASISTTGAGRWSTWVIEIKGGGLSNAVTFLPLSQHGAAGGAAIF